MDISIVIVNYNVKHYVLKCLQSIYLQPCGLEIETIVVDNNSSDGSNEAIQEFYPNVHLIQNKNNAGFPAANNQAFKIAKGKYIFMLNPDAELFENTLLGLFKKMENDLSIGLIAPKLLHTDGSWQQSVWHYPTLWTIFCETFYLKSFLKHKNYNKQNKNEEFEADSFSGAAIFFRKSIIESIGMLDETLFWIEDVDFCYRAKKAGMKLLYYPKVQATHHISVSAKLNYNVSISNQIFNKIKYFRKYKNLVSSSIVLIISLIHVLYKLIAFTVLSPFSVVYSRKAKAYWYTLPKIFNPPKGMK